LAISSKAAKENDSDEIRTESNAHDLAKFALQEVKKIIGQLSQGDYL
jgi:hypothetical protein